MRISDWSSDVCSSDLDGKRRGYRKADDGTIRRELGGILVPAISHAVKSKRLKEADVPHIEMPPEPEARDRWLTDAERERLLSAAMTVYVTSKGGPRGGTPSWQRAKHLPPIYRFIPLPMDTATRKRANDIPNAVPSPLAGGEDT